MMFLKELKIKNFRNYENLDITFSKKINVFFGNNAQGKTNILESIYFLGLTKSHRSFNDIELIRHNQKHTKIEGKFSKENIDSIFSILLEENRKKLLIDNDIIKKTSNYISNINIIIFYPEDLELIKGSPNERRNFLNLELSQLSNNYYCVLNYYNKILKIRNDLLKKRLKEGMLDENYFEIITQLLIEKAIYIYKARYKFITKINEISKSIYKEIIKVDNFNLKYKTNFDFINYEEEIMKSEMKKKYKSNIENEIRYGSTLYGPHKDDFDFFIGDIDLKKYGSQGQQRIAVLTIKLSEIELFKRQLNTTPILLLDDVFSELDDEKVNNLLKYINEETQTIITTTDLNKIHQSIIKKSKIFEVKEGTVIER